MKIAIPVAQGRLCPHFGHCEEFALIDVDPQTRQITHTQTVPAPAHQPGLLPRWLHDLGATVIIAGGMGQRALGLFAQNGIQVIIGANPDDPAAIVKAYLQDSLVTGDNICDH
ncbi:MAG: hypothetical protein Kow0099_08070 [Candidatus Abyssubacteria bacterium]